MLNPQTVRFDKDMCLLDPSKQVVVSTVEFDVTEAAVAEYVAADAYVHLILFAILCTIQHVEEFLKLGFSCGKQG